jgi:hypothetical protein
VSDTWLTPEEVQELTDRQRWTAQCKALATMGIPFRPNAVGRPLVERAAVCSNAGSKPKAAKRGPNWDALHGKAA